MARALGALSEKARAGKLVEANRAYGEGVEIVRRLAALDPSNPLLLLDIAQVLSKLGDIRLDDSASPGDLAGDVGTRFDHERLGLRGGARHHLHPRRLEQAELLGLRERGRLGLRKRRRRWRKKSRLPSRANHS